MLPIIKEVKQKMRAAGGFTLVELMVVLVILAILAGLGGAGLIAYTRLARFERNEANARTVFQTAQIALTRKDTGGDMDDFLKQLAANGTQNGHFTAEGLQAQYPTNAEDKAQELNGRIVALYYDKDAPDTAASQQVHALLDPYVYDESLFGASIVLEIDSLTGQVYSAFYDTTSAKMRFSADGDADGATLVDDRSYTHRRNDSLVGYYSAEDTVNVVTLSQTRLKVKNPQLINNETLTLNWSGNSRYNDLDTIYDAEFYSTTSGDTPLFKLEIEWSKVAGYDQNARIKVYKQYNAATQTWTDSGETYCFPLSYSKGRFILTLDAMCDATLLRAAENDQTAAKTTLFSMTRLVSGAQDIYVKMKARPNDAFADACTESKEAQSNTENTLFAAGSTGTNAALKYFRHLYNLRWVNSGTYTWNDSTLTPNAATTLDWTDGSVTVYCAGEKKNESGLTEPVAKVPSRTGEVVAWPTIPAVGENVTLTGSVNSRKIGGGHVIISNLQLRDTSVAAQERSSGLDYRKRDHYVGLIGENSGTLSKITLRDPDVQINAEVVANGQQKPDAMPIDADGTRYLQPLAETDTAYRAQIYAVGALAGVDTGSVTDCTVDRSRRRGAEAKVTAALTFGSQTTSTARINGTNITDEPHGIGGLVGFAMPANGAKLSDLTLDKNVTVAGLFTDADAAKNNGTTAKISTDAAEKARYNAITDTTATKTLWRAVGVGGVAGVLDVTNLADTSGTVRTLTGITNQATVVGNGFAGGIAGNLYATGSQPAALTKLNNAGTVLAGANYQGGTAQKSTVLGQFFGGIAGYASNLQLQGCTSATRSGLSTAALTSLVRAGYDAYGMLLETSPLKGDFVGGLVGFGRDIALTDCRTESGYVLGRSFVGGFVGGFVGSDLQTSGGENNSYVFGNRYVGGIVSVNGKNSTIKNMTNKGLVAGLGKGAAYVGGIAGVNDATWGLLEKDELTDNITATLQDSANSMSTVEATDKNRIDLLNQLSQTADGTEYYADFVGGVAGCNGTNAKIHWTAESKNGATLGAVLYGSNFVGGVAGYNDPTASILNAHTTTPNVTGTIVATGDCVGGAIGLNGAAQLPAVQVSANKIEGVHFVGGVIGANLPQNSFEFDNAGGTAAPAATVGTGSLVADGVAGGIIGYNRVVPGNTLQTALAGKNTAIADALRALLPTFDKTTHALAEDGLTSANTPVTLTGLSNRLNIKANAYVGGIIGYNAAGTSLTLTNAVNGSQSSAQSYGGLARSDPADAANGGAYIFYNGVPLGELDPGCNGCFAGGIIGYATKNTTLQNCTNYGSVQHPVAAGGLAGVNDGTISGGSMQNSMGSQQENYRYLGGIAGINNGSITNAAPAAGVTIRGGVNIGGAAGYNTGTIRLESATGRVDGITAVGGVAGYNLGTIVGNGVGSKVAVQVSGTSQVGGVAGVNGTTGRISTRSIADKITLTSATSVTANNEGGGAAGRNEGTICNVTNAAGRVHVDNQYMGGLAGRNYGTIEDSNYYNDSTSTDTLYAGGGYAGGITGCNEAGATIDSVSVGGHVTAANGEAGGVTAHNYGHINRAALLHVYVHSTSSAIGGVAAVNEYAPDATRHPQDAVIEDVTLRSDDYGVTLYGPATKVGGLVGYNAGTVKNGKVEAGTLDLSHLTATANTVTAGGAVGENVGTVGGTGDKDAVTVETDLTQSMDKYCNLGGVVGSNSGALVQCAYQGTIGSSADADAAKVVGINVVGSTVGGIVGSNDANGTVQDCAVNHITLHVQGASNVGASQDAAAKMANAAHIGGIVGRNSGKIESSLIATDSTRSTITAHGGFVGGVAGSNSGTITTSGGKDTKALVQQINNWLAVPYKKDADGNPTAEVDTAARNANLNAMVRVLTNATYTGDAGSKPQATQSADEEALAATFKALQGVDEISTGSTENQLKITLVGGEKHGSFANGYLGGITGFNDVTGQISNSASGKWFVYADNINQSWGAVGGIIGQNESNADSTSGLVNLAAVRRFVRGMKNTNDDDTNTENDLYSKTNFDLSANNYVGGVIGTQQNRTGDRWTLTDCVNLGTVFNSRSNNIGGVLAYWLGYGGTVTNCYNFAALTVNANNDSNSGTIGGIAGYFNQPVAGTAVNMISCRNYGDIKKVTNAANDIAGIFGKVQMNVATDAMTINIVDCVNAAKSMQARSMASGILAYIGPYESVPNVEVNIDRCRNYCYEMTASGSSRTFTTGIFGNRGNPTKETTKKTTITNCFTLFKDSTSTLNCAITYCEREDVITGRNNYYMDTLSFEHGRTTDHKIDGLLDGIGRTATADTSWNKAYTSDDGERGDKGIYTVGAHRLYAGVDTGASAATDGDNDYTYFAMLPKLKTNGESQCNLSAISGKNTYIKLLSGTDFSDPASKRILVASDHDPSKPLTEDLFTVRDANGYVGQLLLLYKEADSKTGPTMDDITDEAIQNYYTNLLDTAVPNAPTSVTATRSENDDSVYGRYVVSWTPDETGSPAVYYHVKIYETDETGKPTGTILLESDVYDTRFTFEAAESWLGKYYNVEVKGVNSKGASTGKTMDKPQQFAQTLPTPELEVRLMRSQSGADDSRAYVQVLVLKNADAYRNVPGWSVSARLFTGTAGTAPNYVFTADKTAYTLDWTNCANYGSYTLRGYATSADTEKWMQSEQYNNEIYIPGVWNNADRNHAINPGLAGGTLTANVTVTGSNQDELAITTTLSFARLAADSPVYRVMLLGRALEDTTVTDANGHTANLKGQYITLAAQERTITAAAASITFANLPDDLLSAYDDWIVLAVPVNSGVGDAVTRWTVTDSEAVAAIKSSGTQPAAWYQGLEIIRNSNGSYSYAHLTPLQFAIRESGYTPTPNWATMANGGTIGGYFPTGNGRRVYYEKGADLFRVAKAPQLAEEATYLLNDDNQLVYTFTWTQPDETAAGSTRYKLTLYGVNESTDADGNTHTTEETIALPADANSRVQYDPDTQTYRYTLNIDKDLATDADKTNGSSGWRFDQVRLRVTRDTTGTGSNVIGAADTAAYSVLRRLQQVGQPDQFVPDDPTNAEQLRYRIIWPAVADDRVDHYELWARVQNADGTLGAAEELHPADLDANGKVQAITGTQTVVDLEAYQGKKLVFYVVACPEEGSNTVLRSPNGEESAPQTIVSRTDVPQINGVTFNWTGKDTANALPLMNTFCQELTIEMTVGDSSAASYFFTGYLFDNAEAYKNACALAQTWMGTHSKADLDALNAALAHATLMIPAADRTVGSETRTSGTTVSYTVAPNTEGFTMQPTDANRYLLPALRAMVPNSGSAEISSGWTFYLPGEALQLPKIQLDKPEKDGLTSLTAVTSTVQGTLFDGEGNAWNPSADAITITQYAVQWPAVNEYTQNGTTRSFAPTYQLHVTPAESMPDGPNKAGYEIRFTVAPKDVMDTDDEGNEVVVTHRGQIESVEKLPAGKDADNPDDWLDITGDACITDADGNVLGYDLSIAEVDVEQPVYNEQGKQTGTETVKVRASQPVTLTGHHEMNGDNPIYKIAAVPTLREATLLDGSFGYLVTLPDMVDPAESDKDVTVPACFTAEVTVWAVGDDTRTTNSEPLAVPLPNRTQLTGADPVALMALASVNTQPVQNAESTPADDAGAGEPSATPEMAAPAA